MNIPTLLYLFSFIPVLLCAVLFWADIRKKSQFGRRPRFLLLSLLLLSGIGLFALAVTLFPAVFTPDASLALFTALMMLYIVTFFLAEYSVHSQRLVRSFFLEEFRPRLKAFIVFTSALGLIALAAAVFSVLQHSFAPRLGITAPVAQTVRVVILTLFTAGCLVFLLTVNRNMFYFPSGVIRLNVLLIVSSGISLVLFLAAFLHLGFDKPLPLWLFALNNCAYLARIANEYLFQRTRNLDRTLMKFEETLQLKNDLIAKVVNSPADEDIAIIRASVSGEIDRARAFMAVPEHGISGTVIYTRDGAQLRVSSLDHIDGFCTPIARLETLKLYKNREQFNEIIMRLPFAMNTIIATPKELLPSWGEKLLKEVIETRREVVTADIPPELKTLHTLVGLYPVFDKDYLTGLIVVFKNAFGKLFPEEENALSAVVDNLTVIFSIIKGKQIQRERNRLQGELEIAKQIQTSILPKKLAIPGFECAARMTTASEVGGDVYDCLPAPAGTYLGIGDVSGHGLPAGITALIQLTAFQSAVLSAASFGKSLEPYELYELVNKILCAINKDRIGSDKFMSENYFLIKDDAFAYAGAHLIALHYKRAENTVAELPELANRTAFMGLSPAISARDSAGTFSLAPGDLLLLYTDGIIEAKDNYSHQFGVPRLKEVLTAAAPLPVEEICADILKAVNEHAKNGDLKKYKGNLADDASLVVIRKL